MNNIPAILKSVIIYAICVAAAIIVGYLLTNPLDYSTFAVFGVLAVTLVFPLLMRWHYPLLLLSWNCVAVLFFLKGAPNLWLVMVVLSLGISLLERALNSHVSFVRAPQITWPLLCLLGVVFLTAKLTGGLGLRSFGSDVYGGKKYIFLIIGIVSYFAITACPIPADRAKWYVGLFFLGGTTKMIGDLYPITPSFLHFIFWVFPPATNYFGSLESRFSGLGWGAVSACWWMLAQYGVRGIFLSGKRWRIVLFTLFFGMVFLGGFRSAVFQVTAVLVIMFFLEGMQRTQLLPVFAFIGVMTMVALVPLASHLPYTFQRSLAFLPLDLNQEAKLSAEDSTNWRFEMWKALLPQVPKHLLLGKGYAITMEDFQYIGDSSAFRSVDAGQQSLALSDDYHNGVLSVILPFGIWGLICYVWFMVAALWALYCNWKYSADPGLQSANSILFVMGLIEFLSFASCVSGYTLNGGVGYWAGCVGLSIALNGGVRQPVPQPAQVKKTFNRPGPAEFPLRRRPTFQR